MHVHLSHIFFAKDVVTAVRHQKIQTYKLGIHVKFKALFSVICCGLYVAIMSLPLV